MSFDLLPVLRPACPAWNKDASSARSARSRRPTHLAPTGPQPPVGGVSITVCLWPSHGPRRSRMPVFKRGSSPHGRDTPQGCRWLANTRTIDRDHPLLLWPSPSHHGRLIVTPTVLHATLDLLCDVEAAARPADAVTSAFFRTRRHLDDRDRAAVLAQLYALLRHRARLGWWLARHDSEDTPRNRFLAWLVLGEGKTPNQIRRLLDGAMFTSAALTDPEHALLVKLRDGTLAHPDMPETVRLECPPWAVDPLMRRFGESFAAEMAATLAPPPLDLRVNPIRATRDAQSAAVAGTGSSRRGDAAVAPWHSPRGTPLACAAAGVEDRRYRDPGRRLAACRRSVLWVLTPDT